MASELVVRDDFALGGKTYQRGQHVTDPSEVSDILASRGRFVRAISVAAAVRAPVKPPVEDHSNG